MRNAFPEVSIERFEDEIQSIETIELVLNYAEQEINNIEENIKYNNRVGTAVQLGCIAFLERVMSDIWERP